MTNKMTRIMNTIFTILFRLGGADYNVLKECSSRTKAKYLVFALGLLVSVALAFAGGADIAHQYIPEGTELYVHIAICVAVGLGWAGLIFTYDFGILNVDGMGKFGLVIRVVSGIAAVFLTITALNILMTQKKIDNRINAEKAAAVKSVDERYLSAKETRYKLVDEKKKQAEKYNSEVVQAEANRGYPGPRYNEKKARYDTMIADVNGEVQKLSVLEDPYFDAYQVERNEILSRGSGDFLIKAEALFRVALEGGVISVLVILAFYTVFAAFEMGVLALKATTSENDEYHQTEQQYNQRMEPIWLAAAQAETELKRGQVLLDVQKRQGGLAAQQFAADMQDSDDRFVKEAEIRGKIRILRSKGYFANADALEADLHRLITGRGAV